MHFSARSLSSYLAVSMFVVFFAFTTGHAQKKKTAPKPPAKLVKKTSSVTDRAAAKRADDARRAEEARRNAARLEAERRRAKAAREAQAKRASFENGLRSTTVDNIMADNTEGEDLEVRRAAVNALGSHAGTVVVMEPQTGRILSIVNQDWAIRRSFKPCSTIKLVTAFAGLNENLIDQNGTVTQRDFGMGLDDALAYSNNAYFQRVGTDLGSSRMVSYARLLGLGEPTGLNVPGETGGRVPNGNNNLRIYSHGDDYEVTPLQLAVLVSAISNGGKLVVPQIPRTQFDKTRFQGFMKRRIALPPNTLSRIIPGMVGAASYGTARRGMDSSLEVAGKTGSCIGGGSWLGLFASVAPVADPKLAVVVILRGQSERGKYAAAIAASIYGALRSRVRSGGKQTAKLPLQMKPQTKIDARKAAELDDADSEDSDEDGSIRQGRRGSNDDETQVVVPSKKTQPARVENKPPAPLFPPVVITPKGDAIQRPRIVGKKP